MMIDPSAWNWPQWTYIGLTFLGMAMIAVQHGKPRDGHYNFAVTFVSTLMTLFLLVMGGFFGMVPV